MTTDLPPNVLGGPTRQRYLVGNAPPVALGDLAHSLEVDPNVEVVRIIGPAERPSVLVVSMTEDAAAQLRKRFPGLIVEADAPLSPSQPGVDPGQFQTGPLQTGPGQPGALQPGTPQQGPVQPGTSQPEPGQTGTGQQGESQPGQSQQGPGQVSPS